MDLIYDVETLRNYFCIVVVWKEHRWIFEIHDGHINQSQELAEFLYALKQGGARMVGFNNVNFDYPILHEFLRIYDMQGYATAEQLYNRAQDIIGSQDRYGITIWPSDWYVDQLDLYKIHHFDNRAKNTSLKALEFNMRSPIVQDMPIGIHEPIDPDQAKVVLHYCCNDVAETARLYDHTLPMIEFRDRLSKRFTNFNDTKIGKQTLIDRLGTEKCFEYVNGKRQPRQTHRNVIQFRDIILPSVAFIDQEFRGVHAFLAGAWIDGYATNKPEVLDKLSATVRGFKFDFGAGGIHGSVENKIVRPDADHELIDVDVASYYPNIAIANGLYPQHLGVEFCSIYADLYKERQTYPKKSVESGMLKLALNGVYGESNQIYGSFYDPQYTMAITINGQLLLCMLADWLMQNAGIEMIQINTDGMTVRVHRDAREWFDKCFDEWQAYTRLTLERANYSAMFIRDVNNYIAVDTKGNVKRKGAYQWFTGEPNNVGVSLAWHQDWSALVIPKAAQAAMVDGIPVAKFIAEHADPYDFMLRAKVTGKTRMLLRYPDRDEPVPGRLMRYFISKDGPHLFKHMTTWGKNDEERIIAIDKGWSVTECNDLTNGSFRWDRLNRDYYIKAAEKLLLTE